MRCSKPQIEIVHTHTHTHVSRLLYPFQALYYIHYGFCLPTQPRFHLTLTLKSWHVANEKKYSKETAKIYDIKTWNISDVWSNAHIQHGNNQSILEGTNIYRKNQSIQARTVLFQYIIFHTCLGVMLHWKVTGGAQITRGLFNQFTIVCLTKLRKKLRNNRIAKKQISNRLPM